jgi:hypothetical protein
MPGTSSYLHVSGSEPGTKSEVNIRPFPDPLEYVVRIRTAQTFNCLKVLRGKHRAGVEQSIEINGGKNRGRKRSARIHIAI